MILFKFKSLPLFFVAIILLSLVAQAHALTGDTWLGFNVATGSGAGHSAGSGMGFNPAGGHKQWVSVFIQNVVGQGFVSDVIMTLDNENGCVLAQAFIVTFPPGGSPSDGQKYTLKQLVTSPCALSQPIPVAGTAIGNAFGISQQTELAVNQFVGILLLTTTSGLQSGNFVCTQDDPAGGHGGVGSLDWQDEANTNNLNVGDQITWHGNVVGSGTCPPGATREDFGLGIKFSQPGSSTVNQCIGNCNTVVSSPTPFASSSVNFNISQTIFYLQQVALTQGTVVNVTTVVGQNYNTTFGLSLFLGLYSTNGPCQASFTPGSANCPLNLIQTQSFFAPQKGTVKMTTNLPVVSGQWVGPAFSANRNGLVLNDTTTAITSNVVFAVMPALITSFGNNGLIKTNLKANIISTVGNITPPGVCSDAVDLACFLQHSILALTPSAPIVGGMIYLAAFFIVTIVAINFVIAKSEVDTHIPGVVWLLIFLMYVTGFVAIGIFPVYIIIVEILIVSVVFGGYVGSLAKGSRSSE